ncbi:DoxX family protein [Bacillus suaedaesalsae]|uniref:DoxX family protein n=1 Tax=Bacillus suaedaesalsae TaxID=2810349 RepID=A0ABS2DEU3_9BACI|nr:DoxX family protein [Bacillus suaedaesalsae]MBM6617004.1 DoxX family protein [Bacillus suaedaesalsae]
MRWLKGPIMNIVWTVARIWLGYQWLHAGWGKVTGGFDAEGFLHGAIGKATGDHPAVQGWYATFLKEVALPNVEIINFLIPWGEVLVGVGLIVGLATVPALLAGAFMNLNFLLAGTVSTNPILYTVTVILLMLGTATYFYGLDRLAVPYLNNLKNMKAATINDKPENHHKPAHTN